MHDYSEIKDKSGVKVSQSIDSPISVFEFWELGDMFAALFIILIFGVIFFSWWTMFFLLALELILIPIIRRKNDKGIFIHWPHKKFSMSVPEFISIKNRQQFSD